MIDVNQLNRDIGDLRYNRPKFIPTVDHISYVVESLDVNEKARCEMCVADVVFASKKHKAKITVKMEVYSIVSQDALAQAIFTEVEMRHIRRVQDALSSYEDEE